MRRKLIIGLPIKGVKPIINEETIRELYAELRRVNHPPLSIYVEKSYYLNTLLKFIEEYKGGIFLYVPHNDIPLAIISRFQEIEIQQTFKPEQVNKYLVLYPSLLRKPKILNKVEMLWK